MKPTVAWSMMPLVLAACGPSATTPAAPPAGAVTATNAPADTAPYDTRLPISEFMTHVMQHAADGVWKWQGLVLDKNGEHSLDPKTDEDWEDAESGALILAQVTNVLLIPGRRVDQPGWDQAVKDVRTLALSAAQAAERHDKAAFFKAGSALDEACDACHVRYDPKFKAPPR